ncbi:MAG TPA: AMP-binding protein [Acidimicrobiia bacterium]|nr:AMP-binding protein [Acidimicrobiia bacterium]
MAERHDDVTVKGFYEEGFWTDDVLTSVLDGWCAVRPDAVYVSDGAGSLTYSELRGQAYRLAAGLRDLGVSRGDRVVVQLPNWSEIAVVYVALARIGAVLVPIMPIYRQDEVAYIAGFTEAVGIITTGTFRGFDHLGMVRELRPDCPTLRFVGTVRAEPGPGEFAVADLTRPGDGAAPPPEAELGPPPGPDDPHAFVFTSGTEARPKGCVHTFNTLGFSLRTLGRRLALTPEDVTFMPSPVTHATGLAMGLGAPLVAGGSVHLLDIWDPDVGLRRIAEHRCTNTLTATPFVQMALDAFDPTVHDVSSMRVWVCGGAPVPPAIVEGLEDAWPGCRLLSLYGRSETFLTSMCGFDDPPERSATSDGRPPPGVDVGLFDGEIAQRGAGVMLGYCGDRERTATTFRGGWCHSGDLGRMTDDGYLRVTGRLKDIIIRGGSNISAREVEEHLLAHPAVRDVAVVGMPDRVLGERACAFVVPAGAPPTLEALCEFLRAERRISVTKLPERLELIDALPTTATGKVQKFVLRDRIRTTIEEETT